MQTIIEFICRRFVSRKLGVWLWFAGQTSGFEKGGVRESVTCVSPFEVQPSLRQYFSQDLIVLRYLFFVGFVAGNLLYAESTPRQILLVLSKTDQTLAIVNPSTLKVVARISAGRKIDQ